MAYTNGSGQIRVGVRTPGVAPVITTSTLLTSLYSVWNGETTGTLLDTSVYNAWNGELTGTQSNSLDSGVYLSFNGAISGTTTTDVVGSNNGTLFGVTASTGFIGTSLSFDGVNDYVELPANSLDSITSEFSISFWLKVANTSTSYQILAEQTTTNNNVSPSQYDRGIRIMYSNSILTFTSNNGADFTVSANSAIALGVGYFNNNAWYHYIFTYKQGVGAYIYVNGVLLGSTTTANALTRTSNNIPRIGVGKYYYNGSTGFSSYLNGGIDGFTIWNRQLDSTEATKLFNGSVGISYPYSNKTLYGAYDVVNSINGTHSGIYQTGVTLQNGLLSKSFRFYGNQFLTLPDNSLSPLLLGDFSVSFWINHGQSGSNITVPFCYMSNPSTNVYNGFEIVLAGLIPQFKIYPNAALASVVQLSSGTSIAANTWHHIVVTRKSGTRSIIYINGVQVASNTSTSNPLVSGTFLATIGRERYASVSQSSLINTMMDGITTWTKELAYDEVVQLYNAGNGTQYPFSGQTLPSVANQFGVDNGTLMNGCTFTDGKIGKAFTFDGVNDFVLLPTNAMRFTGDFSFSFFVSLGSTSGQQTVFSCENYLSNENGDKGYTINFNNGVLKFNAWYNSSTIIDSASTTTVTANTWYHFSIVKTSSQVKIYMNGNLQTTTNFTGIVTYNSVVYPAIGVMYKQNNVNNANYHYISAGSKIDALNAWSKALTQDEVTELYNSGNGKQLTITPIITSGLVLNLDASRTSSYPNSGTTWTDISGNGNNGTLTNGPVFGTASGGQITFDGVNDYVFINNNSSFEFASTTKDLPFTFTGWVKPNTGGSFINKGDTGNAANESYTIYITSSSLGITLYDTQGGRSVNIRTIGFTPTQGTWYHFTISYTGGTVDGSGYQTSYNGTTKIYVNGIEYSTNVSYDTSSGSYNRMRVQNTGLFIGSFGSIGTWRSFYNGSLSSTLLYNRVLSSTEVTQNFNATKSRFGL